MYRLSGHNRLRPTGLRPLFRQEVSTLFAYKLEKNVRYCCNKLMQLHTIHKISEIYTVSPAWVIIKIGSVMFCSIYK